MYIIRIDKNGKFDHYFYDRTKWNNLKLLKFVFYDEARLFVQGLIGYYSFITDTMDWDVDYAKLEMTIEDNYYEIYPVFDCEKDSHEYMNEKKK